MVLGKENVKGEIEIQELNDVELFTNPGLVLQGFDYQQILTKTYDSTLFDLKKIRNEKLLVDAEVEWGLKYKEISYIDWQGPVFIQFWI